jgi:hypothetical protein
MSIIGSDDKMEFDADVDPQVPKKRGRQPYPRDAAGNIIRPDGSTSKPAGRPKTKGSLENQISGFVTLVNMFVMSFKPDMALDQIESTALVRALDQECQANARFRKYMESIVKVGGGANLLSVVVLIVGRRAARANLLPMPDESPIKNADIDRMCGALIATTVNKPFSGLNVEPVGV